mgnify:FL=1
MIIVLRNLVRLRFTWVLAISLGCGWSLPVYSAEWQELKDGKTRIIEPEIETDLAPDTQIPLPVGHYNPGEGQIDSAFGFAFGEPIAPSAIQQELGWHELDALPGRLKYKGLVQPLTIREVKLNPPVQPPQLARQGVTYQARLDFDNVPLIIETSAFDDADSVIEVIKRKYGEPDEIDGDHLVYRREQRSLHIFQKGKSNSAFLRYEDDDVATAYITERNRSLKRKFREMQSDRLSPAEETVVSLARQLIIFRQDSGYAFGLPFGRRVSFRAEPDEFVPFSAPQPLPEFSKGEYKIMVSPDLMPIAVRYELAGTDQELDEIKQELELAMELAFAGFLKQTPTHTVLSFNQHAYSLLIRNGKFQFTVHDRQENNARNDRVKLAKQDAAAAKKELERLAELERQRQAIAARQKQIAEERAF